MDELGGPRLDSHGITIRKKRSQSLRRPRPEAHTLALSQFYHESHDLSPLPSLPVSDDLSWLSGNENIEVTTSKPKIVNLDQCISRCTPPSTSEGSFHAKNSKKNGTLDCNAILGDGADHGLGGPSGNVAITVNGTGSESKLKKVKLKVGGVVRTIQAKSSSGASNSGGSGELARSSDAPRSRQKVVLQETRYGNHSPSDKRIGVGIPRKGFSQGSSNLVKEDMGRTAEKGASEKQGNKSDTVRKSKRVPKRRALNEVFDEEDEDDDEIRYLEKLKISRAVGFKDFEEESSMKQGKFSGLSKSEKYENLGDSGRFGKDGKKFRSDRGADDTDYEEEALCDLDSERKKKKQWKDASTSPTESKREVALTTRQRALMSKDASGASQIEFPNGLPPPPSRKPKEKLTEVEQQLKKAEAAQRRRMQNEKAAREIEAEAIRKILGQDSSRKKREEKMKKRREEITQEKAAAAQMLASNTVRWQMGPNGTVVTFPQDMGLPKIFETEVRSYPRPREKCIGPFCTNPYKYRDSKSKLPLCSLQCYKAIQAETQTQATC